jgi:hypothetical protein
MSTSAQKSATQANEISLVELIQSIKKYYNYLLGKWKIICIVGFGGAAIGLAASFLVKPTYTAHLSFALVEKSSSGGLADLASSFGFAGLVGGGSNGAFSGDNLLEIIKSRHAIEQTLLTPVDYKGQRKTLMEAYMDFTEMRKALKKIKKNKDLRDLAYPVGHDRNTFNRTQDSMLYVVYDGFIKGQSLKIIRKDKKVSVVNVDFTSKDELFSKLFVETLMDQTYRFYRQTKTAQSRYNIDMMQQKADSVRALYEAALYKGAGYSQVNINPALQYAAVPRMKQESEAQLYGTVYTEILKNLETLKLDLARETPLVQVIDQPIFPLKKEKLGKIKGPFIGGVIGGVLIVVYLLGMLHVKELGLNLKSEEK